MSLIRRFRTVRDLENSLVATGSKREFYRQIRTGSSVRSLNGFLRERGVTATDAAIKKYIFLNYSNNTISRMNTQRTLNGLGRLFIKPVTIANMFGLRRVKMRIQATRRNGEAFTYEKWIDRQNPSTFDEIRNDLEELSNEPVSDSQTDFMIDSMEIVI